MKLQRRDVGVRKSVQHPNPPQPEALPVQNAGGSAHQESGCPATNDHARTDHQPSQIIVYDQPAILQGTVKKGKGNKTRQREEEVGRQHQGMDGPGVRQVPEGSGEPGKNGGNWL